MRKSYNRFLSKICLLFLLFGLSAVGCFGQTEVLIYCKEEDHDCRAFNYERVVYSKCKGRSVDCQIAEQTKIIESNPNDPAAYYRRGRIYDTRDPDRAILDFNKALELAPKFMSAYKYLWWNHIVKREYDQAIAVMNKAIEVKPNFAAAYNSRGYMYSKKREFDKALADYNKAIELEPNKYDGYSGRAGVYEHQREFDKALADYNKAIELSPRNWRAYYDRGYFYWKQGEKAKAEADCQKTRELKVNRRPLKLDDEYCPL
jgi:tetratricopeptide (TPR) repeat protein